MRYGYSISPNGERISGEGENFDEHIEIVLRETTQGEYPRIRTVAPWSYRKANKLQPMADVIYVQPYGGTSETVKFILKTFPWIDVKTIRTSVKMLIESHVKLSIVYIQE